MKKILKSHGKVACLDVDGTIVLGSVGVSLARVLQDITGAGSWITFWEKQSLFKRGSYDYAIRLLSQAFAKGVKGLSTRKMERALGVLEREVRIRPSFEDFHGRLVKKGFSIHLITSSPVEACRPLLQRFRFESAFGLVLEKKGLSYTGKVVRSMTVAEKRQIVKALLRSASFSIGVGDNANEMAAFEETSYRFLLSTRRPECLPEDVIGVRSFREITQFLKNRDQKRKTN